jgi:hypothetical protein
MQAVSTRKCILYRAQTKYYIHTEKKIFSNNTICFFIEDFMYDLTLEFICHYSFFMIERHKHFRWKLLIVIDAMTGGAYHK